MKKISRTKFQIKCEELNIGSNQSMFFKTGFFQKFGCSPFCNLHTISTSAKKPQKLKVNFAKICQKYANDLSESSNILIHFQINEAFPFMLVQEMMQIAQLSTKEDTNIVMGVKYRQKDSNENESVSLFLEKE